MFNYIEFKQTYIAPTRLDYLKSFLKIPTVKGAIQTASYWKRDPMSETEYQEFLDITNDSKWNNENADRIQRLRCRTTFGFYLADWFKYFSRPFTDSFERFSHDHFDNAYNEAVYNAGGY
ncbi:hypothetical protein PP940_gp129 [Rhizobium phage RL2RES]|uniref:Uncharacterized protein n=1 Tax=Rhizobium phage RL2RES TaxID=103371 RepID=A0A6B9J1S6_9CAUD|nr:hypothetical protein PP940_gp129 [Rhizobium phage RL2RES]QGZ14234.1 hypothetical protein RL2RES_129 [Rhizobium phage RL2RES]